ncbi:MAG TPA: hypothetical protein PKH77_01440 [Anaerolineae bacterium]|nr:hypothetical protein [Anaerolineae bacterium]
MQISEITQRGSMLLLTLVLLAGCTSELAPTPLRATATLPPPTATTSPPTNTPTPTLPPTPTLTPTPTPLPTPDPALLLTSADAGLARVRAVAGETPLLCLRYEDTDADGAPEWLALTHQAGAPSRLSAFVLDGEAAYWLEPAFPKVGVPDVGLGQYATCEVEVRDVNVDGMPDIAIFGHADKNETQLHLFSWDGTGYRRLGRFSGDAGVQFMDADGDLEWEIWEGYRDQAAPSLTWHVIYTWKEGAYGWTSDRYGWYALERPHSYPTHKPQYAVIAFYLALNDRDLPGAYALLLPRAGRDYDAWALGYATTARVSVGDAHTIPDTVTETSARVSAMVTAWDNRGGVIVGRLWNVEWDTQNTADGWRLGDATATLLEEWPVSYWP